MCLFVLSGFRVEDLKSFDSDLDAAFFLFGFEAESISKFYGTVRFNVKFWVTKNNFSSSS